MLKDLKCKFTQLFADLEVMTSVSEQNQQGIQSARAQDFPVSDTIKVIEGSTVYKSEKWWSAVCLIESFGRKQIAVYVWNQRNGEWKRRQKFVLSNKGHWEKVREIINSYISKL